MYDTDPITGLLTKVKKVLIPSFAPAPTNQNPHRRTGTMPRLRHFNKKHPRRLRLPANRYGKTELAAQQKAVENYHKQQDPNYRRKMEGRARALEMQMQRALMEQHKANKPIIED